MEEKNNRYTGKRWVSREESDRKDSTYGKKSYTGEKRSTETKGSYRKDGYRGGKSERGSYSGGRYTDNKKDGNTSDREYSENRTYSRDSKERTTRYGNGQKNGTRGYDRNANKGYDRDKENTEAKRTVDTRENEPAENKQAQAGGDDVLPFLIIGRNAVREAIKSERSIDRILVVPERDGSLNEILTMAHERKLVIRETDKKKIDEICMPFGHGGKTANHQGIVAYAAGMEYCGVADILKVAKEKNEDPFVIVLDGVEDPHNLGSIIRSAECAGAHGVIIGKRRSASVTAAAVKAAAGATAYMKVARVTNVTGALEELKRAGLWIAGADMSGVSMHEQGMNGPLAIVIGGEGGGLTKLVRETCDFLISIPMKGQINSLNASVAAAVLMFEKKRQDSVEE